MFNNNYMMEKYQKNSLLGQLKRNGVLTNDIQETEPLPFGILTGNIETSPFHNSEVKTNPIKKESQKEPKFIKKRLNELDNNLFQKETSLNINDKELSSGEKIKKIKTFIKNIDEKLFMLEDSDDKKLVEKLKSEKEALNDALMLLEGENQDVFHRAFVSQNEAVKGFAEKIHIKDGINKFINAIMNAFPRLKKNFMVKKALNKLVMLNDSVNSLCTKQIPYGESEGRYNDFIAYLSCANVIHAKLTKKM